MTSSFGYMINPLADIQNFKPEVASKSGFIVTVVQDQAAMLRDFLKISATLMGPGLFLMMSALAPLSLGLVSQLILSGRCNCDPQS